MTDDQIVQLQQGKIKGFISKVLVPIIGLNYNQIFRRYLKLWMFIILKISQLESTLDLKNLSHMEGGKEYGMGRC